MEKKSFTGGLDTLLQATQEQYQPLTSEIEPKKRGRPKTYTRIITKMSQKGVREGETRATFLVKEASLERLKALAFWKRKDIKAVLNEALDTYFKTQSSSEIKQAEKAYRARSQDLL